MALNDVPQPAQSLNVTQAPIRSNFSTIDTTFSIDHAAYGSANAGKHNKVSFPLQLAAPVFAANEMGLFNQNTVVTGRPDVWMARAGAAAFPITGYANGAIVANNAVSWTYLPSGLKIIGGQSTTAGGTKTIIFNDTANGGLTGFPGFSSFVCYIQVVRIDNSGGSTTVMRVRTFTLLQTVIGLANGATDSTFFWSAMGL